MRYDCECVYKWRRSESSLNVNRAYKQHVEKQDTKMKTTAAAAAAAAATAHATQYSLCCLQQPIKWWWLFAEPVRRCYYYCYYLLSLLPMCFLLRAVQSFVYAVRFSLLSLQTNQSNTLNQTTDNAQLNNDCWWMVVVFAAVAAAVVMFFLLLRRIYSLSHTFTNERKFVRHSEFHRVVCDTCSVQLGCANVFHSMSLNCRANITKELRRERRRNEMKLCPRKRFINTRKRSISAAKSPSL